MTDTQTTPPTDPAAPTGGEDPAAVADDPVSEPTPGRFGPRRRIAASTGVAWIGAVAVVLIATSRRTVELHEGESLLLRVRPRRPFWRYVSTAGLWEIVRRSTLFAVTDRRVVIDQGLLYRGTRSIPLSSIQNVSVLVGPVAGNVALARGGGSREIVGPFRSPQARQFASMVITAAARTR